MYFMHQAVRTIVMGKFSVVILGILLLMSVSTGLAQFQQFEVPLYITDDSASYQLYFGILNDAVFGLRFGVGLPTDSINGRMELEFPPIPPEGIFDARFVWPRGGVSPEPPIGFGQGGPHDYRPYVSATQRDTFRVRAQLGAGNRIVASWPAGLSARFTGLTMRHFDGNDFVFTNMLTNTSADITDLSSTFTVANIYSAGIVVSVQQIPGVPTEFALSQNYPNPFNPSTTIDFAVPHTAETEIAVYDILGQKVATIAKGLYTTGFYTVTWDGKNGAGADVSSGVYFVRMTAAAQTGETANSAGFSSIRKLLLVR
jgi:hypothetical protein